VVSDQGTEIRDQKNLIAPTSIVCRGIFGCVELCGGSLLMITPRTKNGPFTPASRKSKMREKASFLAKNSAFWSEKWAKYEV